MSDQKTCKSCRFYVEDKNATDGNGRKVTIGLCFRYPPQAAPFGWAPPTVDPNRTWCGEYRAIPPRRAAAKPKGARK